MRAARPSPAQRVLVLGALLAICGLAAFDLALWLQADQLPGRSICCDMSSEGVRAVSRAARAEIGLLDPWQPQYGLLPSLSAEIFARAPRADAFQGSVALFAVLLSLLLFDIGRMLAGPKTGLLAAALAPLTPILAFAGRRWDTQGPLGVLVALGAWSVLRSKGLSRPLPTALVAGVGMLMVVATPRETDDLLALATLGAIAGLAALRSTWTGRDADGQRLARWKPSLGLLAVSAGVAAFMVDNLYFTSPEGAGYYLTEAQASGGLWQALGGLTGLLAYGSHLYWRGLTPWLALPLQLGCLLYALRGRGRAELAGWALVPLVVLSLLPKRNYYYLSMIWPALPLLLALGVAAIPGKGRVSATLRGMVALGLLGVGLVQHLDRAFPGSALDPIAGDHRWLRGSARWNDIFQTQDDNLNLAPAPAPWIDDAVSALSTTLQVDPCRCETHVLAVGRAHWGSVNLALLPLQPCLDIRMADTPPRNGFTSAVLAEVGPLAQIAPPVKERIAGLVERARFPGPTGEMVVLGAPDGAPVPDCKDPPGGTTPMAPGPLQRPAAQQPRPIYQPPPAGG